MSLSIKRFALLGLVIVGAFAATATSAMADVSPASTALTATSTNSSLAYSGTTITCTTASATGTTPARGTSALSVRLTFGVGGSCRAFGLAATVSCTGSTTLRLTRFASPSGTGTTALDSDFNCTIRVTLAGCTVTVQGPQSNVGTWSFTNTTQVLANAATNVAGTDSGGTCAGNTAARSGRGTGSFTGDYRPNVRVTVS